MKFEDVLQETIEDEFEHLGDAEVGSNEYKARVETITKFMDRAIEIEKCNNEKANQDERRELENKLKEFEHELKQAQLEHELKQAQLEHELKQAQLEEEKANRRFDQEIREKQMKEDKVNRIVTNIITAVSITLPIVVTIWGTKKSFEFEKEGTITTIMGRGFVNKLLPKK